VARDELDLSDYRPSRLPRVLMIVSALAIVAVAAWFFAPILLAGYAKATATAAVGPKAARPAQPRVATRSVTPAVEDTASAPVMTAAATRHDDTASLPAAPRATDSKAAAPWPTDMPAWPQPQPQPVAAAPAAPPPAQPAAPPQPTEAANPNPMQLASVTPPDTNADNGANTDTAAANPDLPAIVPLPRSRPSRQIAARLAIPLPRPRPQIEADVPTAEMRAFELQVDRMR
jgi:hypothetical protein